MAGEKTADKAVGRTRGGLNTKLHAIADGLGNPVEFLLSAGNDNDCVHAVELLEKVELSGSNVLADRAYGARSIREYISKHGANYVIPPQSNVSNPWPVDWSLYKERHLVECFFQKIKWFRRIATRYDKLDCLLPGLRLPCRHCNPVDLEHVSRFFKQGLGRGAGPIAAPAGIPAGGFLWPPLDNIDVRCYSGATEISNINI